MRQHAEPGRRLRDGESPDGASRPPRAWPTGSPPSWSSASCPEPGRAPARVRQPRWGPRPGVDRGGPAPGSPAVSCGRRPVARQQADDVARHGLAQVGQQSHPGLEAVRHQEALLVEGDQRGHVAQLPAHLLLVARRCAGCAGRAGTSPSSDSSDRSRRNDPSAPASTSAAAGGRLGRADPRPGPGDRGRRAATPPPGPGGPRWPPPASDRRRARPRWRCGPPCPRRPARRHRPPRSPG